MTKERVEEELRASPAAIRVYTVFVNKNPTPLSLSDLADELGLTKPAVHHQVQKLLSLGLIESEGTKYRVKEFVPVGTLKAYVSVKGRFVSRYFLYSLVFLGLIIFMVAMQISPLTLHGFVAYIGSIVAFAVNLREHLRWL